MELLLTSLLKNDLLYVLLIDLCIDKACSGEFFWLHIAHSLISETVKICHIHVEMCSDVCCHDLPDRSHISGYLFAVGIRHLAQHIWLNSRLERTYSENLDIDIELFEQALEVWHH